MSAEAERRLTEHLELLRSDPPRSSGSLPARVRRAARWQRAVRTPLVAAGRLAGAVAEGVAVLLGMRGGRR